MTATDGATGLPPCERFTVLDTRKGDVRACDVCDQPEASHENSGRRILSGGEIEAIRRQIIVERFALREAQQEPPADKGGQA